MAFGTIIDAIAEGSYFLYFPFQAWLYLFSSDYRNKMKIRWENNKGILVLRDIVGLILGFIISVLIVGFIVFYFMS